MMDRLFNTQSAFPSSYNENLGESSKENAAPAEPVPLDARGVRRGDGGEIGVDLDIWKMRSESSDSLPGDQLTIVSEITSINKS